MRLFDNKVVVVTGGTQGLGAATAKLLAERGSKGLVICGRSQEKGRQKAAELKSSASKRSTLLPTFRRSRIAAL
jgi:NAD(P)-dependent dehydrogenase (short-subunit alcohol dehydrogenase family)